MLVAVPGVAIATSASGVTGRTIAETTVGGQHIVFREITIEPGGSTGWHYHDGLVYAVVERGILTRDLADCRTTMVHPKGSVVVEQSGPGHVHIGRNLGSAPVVLKILYINPAGSPLARDVPDPGCGFG